MPEQLKTPGQPKKQGFYVCTTDQQTHRSSNWKGNLGTFQFILIILPLFNQCFISLFTQISIIIRDIVFLTWVFSLFLSWHGGAHIQIMLLTSSLVRILVEYFRSDWNCVRIDIWLCYVNLTFSCCAHLNKRISWLKKISSPVSFFCGTTTITDYY